MPNGGERGPQTERRRWIACIAWIAWIALPLLIACAGNDPATQIERAGSWAATTRELAIERRVGAIGRAYTADLLDAGGREVQMIQQSLKPSELPESIRSRVPIAVGRLDSVIANTGSAVRRGDVVALGMAAADANALSDTLRVLRAALVGK
jgi:hypothetical protein